MKYRLSQGGSYMGEGARRADFASTKAAIDSMANARRAQLDTLSEATEEFKCLETHASQPTW